MPGDATTRVPEPAAPLADIRVVELGGIGPTPFAGLRLAELGADDVRVDRPGEDRPRGLAAGGRRGSAARSSSPSGPGRMRNWARNWASGFSSGRSSPWSGRSGSVAMNDS